MMLSRLGALRNGGARRSIAVISGVNQSLGNDRGLSMSTSTSTSGVPFRPRRRSPKSYRAIPSRVKKARGPMDPLTTHPLQKRVHNIGGDYTEEDFENDELAAAFFDESDPLEVEFGPEGADLLRHEKRERSRPTKTPLDVVEEQLRLADYMTASMGSTEDLVGQRRALAMDTDSPEEREEFMTEMEQLIKDEHIKSLNLGALDDLEPNEDEMDIPGSNDDDNDQHWAKQVHGDWSETVVRVDRVQKVQRGGTMVRYRALVVGGNCHGCAGFGIAKRDNPQDATEAAARLCKRNIFFIDRYRNSGLTSDLAGRHNSCRVILRHVQPHMGLKGHPLVEDILKYFGISDCSAKTHGNRNIYNVVRATFKAIMTHESMEEIALKRGKRLMPMDRARRLQI